MLEPPVKPMLAKSHDSLPSGHWYEPKWDGFRALIFRTADGVEIGSRTSKLLTRYFPEIVDAAQVLPTGCVLDGEIVMPVGDRLEFEVLGQRIHPAESRITRLASEFPARFVGFDLLASDGLDRLEETFADRRARLVELMPETDRLTCTPLTTDRDQAQQWFDSWESAGIDGIVAKHPELTYQPGKRVMIKVKHKRTADVVLAGFRVHKNADDQVGSLLLGLHDDDGQLHQVGVSSSFTEARRRELFTELAPLRIDFEDHPWTQNPERNRWNQTKDLSFQPLAPEVVLEVQYDFPEGRRFRHTTKFLRWRPDREPESCLLSQLDVDQGPGLGAVWAGRVS